MTEYVAIVEIDDPDDRAVSTEAIAKWVQTALVAQIVPRTQISIRKVEVRTVERD